MIEPSLATIKDRATTIPDPRIGVGAGALVINESNKVLLLQRPNSLIFDGGLWSQPGGALEFGEDPMRATIRHLEREVGIVAKSLKLLTVHSHISEHQPHDIHWISICYLCTDFTGFPDRWEGCVDLNWDWFPITSLPSSLTEYTEVSLQAFFQRLRA